MNAKTRIEVFAELCRLRGEWGMFVSFYTSESGCPDFEELQKAAPYLSADSVYVQMWADGCGFFFGSEAEIQHLYDQTVGDDGPTASNPYNGPARVYALMCGPDGELGGDNT